MGASDAGTRARPSTKTGCMVPIALPLTFQALKRGIDVLYSEMDVF